MKDPGFAHFGSRLRLARKMAGLSLGDLSGKIGGVVTRQALSKYEKGRMMPSPEVLCRLNVVLGLRPESPADFLSAPLPASARGSMPDLSLCLREEAPPYMSRIEYAGEDLRDESRASRLPDDMAGLASRRRFRMPRPADTAPTASAGLIDGVRFREKEKVPAKAAAALRLRIKDYVNRSLEAETFLGVSDTFQNPLAGCAVKTAADAEAAAGDVRRAWSLGSSPVKNLLGLLEEVGIMVFEVRGIERFEGLSGTCAGVPFMAVSRDSPDDRMRFTAAHELAHILCGFPEREGAESLCHQFAGAFLLPPEVARRTLLFGRRKLSLFELAEIKQEYGISLQAIVRRALSLGIVSARKARSFRETMRAKGWLVTEPVDYRGSERTTKLMRILCYAVAEGIIPAERAAELAGVSTTEFANDLGNLF